MSARQKAPTVLTAATTHWAPTPVCATQPMSSDPMENSVTVSLNPLNITTRMETFLYLAGMRYFSPFLINTHDLTVNL